MTKEQFKTFVGAVIDNPGYTVEQRIVKIVAQWESDVNDARISAVNDHIEDRAIAMYEDDNGSAACEGPCCR